jgi:polar amino acid transport system permease protein/polar amino acid transport system substrate-binding protein
VDFNLDVFVQALTSRALREGVVITISLTIVSFVAGLAIGLGVALMRGSRFALVRLLAWGYIWIFRALPTLVLLFFVWYALPQLVPALRGPGFLPFYAAAIALSVNEAAYAAEIIRGGLLSIDDGQRLAARALGMPPLSVFRRVMAPQLVRVVIPPIANDFITLLKITSLASAVSLREIMTQTQTQIASSFRYAEWFGAAAVYYLVLVSIFMVAQAWFERRYVWTSQARSGRSLGVLRGLGAR